MQRKKIILFIALALFVVGLVFEFLFKNTLSGGGFACSYFAAGDFACGIFAIGTFSVGIFSVGIFSVGIFSLGIFNMAIYAIGLFMMAKYQQFSVCSPCLINQAIHAS